MKKLSFLLLFLFCFIASSQEKIAVKKVMIKSTLSFQSENEIPKVIALKKEFEPAVKKINQFILDEFMIEGYQLKKEEDFRFSGCTFEYQINPDYLFLKMEGGYLGPYPSEFEKEFIFNIKTGAIQDSRKIPFQALFTLNGYLDFMEKYWLPDIKKEFSVVTEGCEEIEPYCSYYDIEKYEVKDNQLSFSLTNDCYPHVAQACTPYLTKSVSKEVMKQYLNDWAYRMLFKDNYTSKNQIALFLMNQKEKPNCENNIYFFGKINNLYPISMALNLSKKDNSVSGYYYYDKKKIKIKLSGTYSKKAILLNEFSNNVNTGKFSLKFEDDYNKKGFYIYENETNSQYLTGQWSNGKSDFQIIFNEVKFNQYNKALLGN